MVKKRKAAPAPEEPEPAEPAEPAETEQPEEPVAPKVPQASKAKKRKGNAGSVVETAETAATAERGEAEEAAQPAEAETFGADAAERFRRALQRDIQKLVLRLRSEGKTKWEIKRATAELKAKSGAPKSSKEKPSKKKLKEAAKEETRKEHLQHKHDLVVIPVIWRGRHDKLDVIQAAEDIKACLAQQGLDVWLDGRRHLTPGQKFAHWEYRGVMLRVEVGPQDVQAKVCQVCRAKTAGDYQSVERKKVPLPPTGARSLLLRLKEWGLSQIDVERREGDSDEEEAVANEDKAKKQRPKADGQVEADEPEDDLQGNWKPSRKEASSGKKKKKGKS